MWLLSTFYDVYYLRFVPRTRCTLCICVSVCFSYILLYIYNDDDVNVESALHLPALHLHLCSFF